MYNGDTKEFEFEETSGESVNEIIEIRNGEEIESLEDEILDSMTEAENIEKPKKKKKNIFKVIKDKWNDFSKKQKIITIVIGIVILLAIIIGLVLILKKDKNEEKAPDVVLEADNYRYENGKLFFLNDKEEIGSYDCQNKDETLCYVAYSSLEDEFDITKSIYNDEEETPVEKRMSIIDENYVFIFDNKDKDEENIILHSIKENADYENYKFVKEYNLEENYIIAKDKEENYGVIKFSEEEFEEVIEFKYDYLGVITENKDKELLVALKNDKWYLIDFNAKEITKAIDYQIKNYNESLLSVINDEGEYNLVDYNNNTISEESYDYINFIGEYVILIKDKELFIADDELNKFFEEGKKLTDKNYNQVNVYNKKSGKLIENRYAYKVDLNNNTIELTIKDIEEPILINVLESKVSNNYDYISYYDETLYFYSDAEKTNLLGSYKCTNANDITSEESTLNNCYIASSKEFSDNDMTQAKNSVGLLPIFNNRFVFIKDVPSLNTEETMNIVLYDLKADKKLGTYRSIDAMEYNGKTDISFAEVTNTLIMAKNTKDYYGIIKINLSEVVSLSNVKFGDKNKNVEKINENYIIQKSNDKYYMINNAGEALTSEFDGKIMGYNTNYVKVKSGDNYLVYGLKGEEVSKTKFKYVELYDTFYAGVDTNNKINLYKYDNPEKIFATDIDLSITSNYKDGKSFKAFSSGEAYKVEVYNVNGSVTTYDSTTIVSDEVTE